MLNKNVYLFSRAKLITIKITFESISIQSTHQYALKDDANNLNQNANDLNK